jgi:hypothetical protein
MMDPRTPGRRTTARSVVRAAPPPIDDVRAWIRVPATLLPDPQLQQVIDAEALIQARLCRVPEDPNALTPDLVQAIYRRVAREVAAKGVPLGMMGGDSEYGTARLSRFDAEIERLEGPNRKVVVG